MTKLESARTNALSGPFGTPDGSRADIEDIQRDFIDLDDRPAFGGVATRADDAKVRVIVGRMGAGKTVYMRRLFSFQTASNSVYADNPQQALPQTDVIVRACQWFPKEILSEKWSQIWHRAILRSLTTHLLESRELRGSVESEEAARIRADYGDLLGRFRKPRSIYSELRDIINSHNSAIDLMRYLEQSDWDDLEYDLAGLLHDTKPVFFYLDAIDDNLNSAPFYWLRCQEGLFFQVMQLLRDGKFGSRLHVVVCIRDLVLSSINRSENAPKYYNEPHIRVLDWSKDAIEFLLRQKIERLPPEYLMAPALPRGPEAWLGCPWVHNEARGVTEDVLEYLIRHTRLIPRDVISLGNDLCRAVLRQKELGNTEVPNEVMRRVVSHAAKRFGDSQLAQCANQIAADLMPRNAAQKGYSEFYTSNQEYATSLREQLKDVIRAVGVDRFDRASLNTLEELSGEVFEHSTHVPSVLWQNGLLGLVRDGRSHFYSVSDMSQLTIPPDADEYVLHPCVIDAVPSVKPVGAAIVYPYDRD
ncbi:MULTISPECIES: P-loop ATPase, Sll1717 family [unclassified Geodermatophilus]|uniref:P-loop ATPase, Sll1717 family n=1 Tax=unclassified Geodermatophilus TaxID=2637632 RepID=UPI003EEEFFBD